ncbi:MAG: glutamate racemase [Oscillatoriales cyanobacterium RM1_1_9]|nr:glutamate racemase [Oscillatoriales cyanobacterium RM1_1_9]
MATDKRQQRIAVFDSGVGGLTVLSEIYRQLPQESVVYFADTARLPYGMRSPQEILQFVREIITWAADQSVKMVVMACNTSSALALETVQSEFDLPILGIILPGAKAAVQIGTRVGVIATPATAASNVYRQAIQEINPDIQVWQIGCPEFVPLIEQNQIHHPQTYALAREYISPLLQQGIDTLIYGCTHYPHLAPILRSLLPNSVQLLDPAAYLVQAMAQELELLGLANLHSPQPTRFCVSGTPEQFAESSKRWLGIPQ